MPPSTRAAGQCTSCSRARVADGTPGIQASTAMEQAYPLLFLCSDAASAISGITLISDAGWTRSGITGSFPNATMIARVLMGRT